MCVCVCVRVRVRVCVCTCVRVLLQYKALDTVSYKWPTWHSSDQSAHQTSFFAYHLRWTNIPKTHTGLQKIQKIPINFTWRGIIMPKYPYIKP